MREQIRILHLSDTHVPGGDVSDDGGALEALERLLADLVHIGDVDLVLISGDISDDGSVSGCERVRDRIGEFASARGIPQVYLPGNTDDRESFRAALGSGHLDPHGHDRGEIACNAPEIATASQVDGLRIISLDSAVPGAMSGTLGEGQLDWLRHTLRTPAARGTVIALHHPPLRMDDSPFLSAVGLDNPADLAQAIRGTDVRAILCGHFHLHSSGSLSGVPIWVAPGVETRIDVTAPRDTLRFISEPGANLVTLSDLTGIRVAAVSPRSLGDGVRTVSVPLTD